MGLVQSYPQPLAKASEKFSMVPLRWEKYISQSKLENMLYNQNLGWNENFGYPSSKYCAMYQIGAQGH